VLLHAWVAVAQAFEAFDLPFPTGQGVPNPSRTLQRAGAGTELPLAHLREHL